MTQGLYVYCKVDEDGCIRRIQRTSGPQPRDGFIEVTDPDIRDTIMHHPDTVRWNGSEWVPKHKVRLAMDAAGFIVGSGKYAQVSVVGMPKDLPPETDFVHLTINDVPVNYRRGDPIEIRSDVAGMWIVRLADKRFYADRDFIIITALDKEGDENAS